MLATSAVLVTVLSVFPTFTAAYTWNFGSTPKQCSNLTINIQDQGNPPYRILIIPFGASPLPNNVEARTILDKQFDDSSSSITFPFRYPANSQFVAVVSDASGFGSGGTSAAATVSSSSDISCFDSSKSVQPFYVFNIDPPNQLVQCSATRIWWDPSTVQGTTSFLGVIPGGQSFSIPQGPLTNVTQEGTGFSWTPSVRGGTTLVLVGGDDRGAGSSGSVLFTVGSGLNPSTSCLNSTSPSSTAGSPAGGSYPTSSSAASTGASFPNKSSTNVGAIVGGVIGGIVALAALGLLLLFFYRRQRFHASQKEKPVDLFQGGDEGDRNELPNNYRPEPFVDGPPQTINSADGHSQGAGEVNGGARPLSGATSTSRSGTPDIYAASSAGTRKSGIPRMRPVNVVQHDDAGPSEAGGEEAETVELPPAYTNIRK